MEKKLEELFTYMNDGKEKLEVLHNEIKELNEQKNEIDDKESFFYKDFEEKYQEKLNEYSIKQQTIKSHIEKEKKEIENSITEELKEISTIEEKHQQKAKEAKELREHIEGKKAQFNYLKESLDSSDKNTELIKNEEQQISDLEDKLNITYTELRNLTSKKENLIPEGNKPEKVYLQKQKILKAVNGLNMSNIDETKENINKINEPKEEKTIKAEPVKAKAEPVKTETIKAEPVKVKAEPVKTETVKAEPVKAKAEPVKTETIKAEPVKVKAELAKEETTKIEQTSNINQWHPKLTDEQVEELIAEGINPGDNEYDQYLWEHNINPFEKINESKIEPKSLNKAEWHNKLTQDEIDDAISKGITKPEGPEYEQFLLEHGIDTIGQNIDKDKNNSNKKITADDNKLKEITVDPLNDSLEFAFNNSEEAVMNFLPKINYKQNDMDEVLKILKHNDIDIEDIKDSVDTNVIGLLSGIKCNNTTERLNDYCKALKGEKTDLKITYNLKGIYKSDFSKEEIKNIIRIAKNARKANKDLVNIKQDNLLTKIADRIGRNLKINNVKRLGSNIHEQAKIDSSFIKSKYQAAKENLRDASIKTVGMITNENPLQTNARIKRNGNPAYIKSEDKKTEEKQYSDELPDFKAQHDMMERAEKLLKQTSPERRGFKEILQEGVKVEEQKAIDKINEGKSIDVRSIKDENTK